MRRSRGLAASRLAFALAVTIGSLGLMITGPLAPARAQSAATTVQRDVAPAVASLTSAAGKKAGTEAAENVTVLGQSAWVSDGHVYRLRLGVPARLRATAQLQVTVYNPLTTRSGFDAAMSGQVHGYAVYSDRVAVSALRPDPAGGLDLDIPVNEGSTGRIPSFYTSAGSAIFPVRIGVVSDSGATQEAQVSSFLVYGQPQSVSGLPKLSVSLVLPFRASPLVADDGRIGPLPAAQSVQLAGIVNALAANPGIRLTLAITPETLEALDSTSASHLDRTTLATLINLVHDGNVEVAPEPYASVPLQGWDAAGLGAELASQLATGSSVFAGLFGTAPAAATWVVNGSLDSDALRILQASGAKRFILPDAQLSALPAVAQETTFALPTQLAGAGARAVVYGADSGLTADFSSSAGPVLAASQLLAEMAMIQLETPGLTRGVAVLPPPGWSANVTFVQTLLAGLQGHPLLNPVTASGLFGAVQVFPVQRSLVAHQASGTAAPSGQETLFPAGLSAGRSSVGGTAANGAIGTGSAGSTGTGETIAPAGASDSTATSPQGQTIGTGSAFGTGSGRSITTVASGVSGDIGTELGPDIPAILAARRGLAGMVAVLPQEARRVVVLNKELLTAESSDLTETQRRGLLTEIQAAITKVTSLITLPRSTSITLTSMRGSIPLTVLSTSSLHARVELRLSSERLIFQRFSPPNGHCTVPTSTTEVCDLTVTTHNTTLKVPVEARTSGVFPVQVSLWTPDGSQLIAQARDTVRSTAVSGVGVVLILVAVISLGIWWIRDLRHGRRARRLVPAPPDDPVLPDDPLSPDDGLSRDDRRSPDHLVATDGEVASGAVITGRLGDTSRSGDHDGRPVGDDRPAVRDDRPAVRDDRPAVRDDRPAVPDDLPDPESMVRQFHAVPAAEREDRTSGRLS